MNEKGDRKMNDFDKEVKRQYDDMMGKERRLKKELSDIGKKIKSLRLYLVETGMVEKKVKKANSKLIA